MRDTTRNSIIFRELATFVADFGFQVDIRHLKTYSSRIAHQITASEKTEVRERLLTRKQCAEFLGVSLPTLDKYIRQEGLPYRVKNPNAKNRVHYLFSQSDVLEWSQSHLSGFGRRNPK